LPLSVVVVKGGIIWAEVGRGGGGVGRGGQWRAEWGVGWRRMGEADKGWEIWVEMGRDGHMLTEVGRYFADIGRRGIKVVRFGQVLGEDGKVRHRLGEVIKVYKG
jgi:hypothetical protein